VRGRRWPSSYAGSVIDVAIVHLGRAQAHGEVRRVAGWRALFSAADASVEEVAVEPPRLRLPEPRAVIDSMRGRVPPEAAAWSARALRGRLDDLCPRVVLVVSARAYTTLLPGRFPTVVVDVVDRLDRSYADRGRTTRGAMRRVGYRLLALAHRRVNRGLAGQPVRMVAAGWRDAGDLGAEWVPNVVDDLLHQVSTRTPDHDVVFVGTLRYPPNQVALQRLERLWSGVTKQLPDATALIAGADPPAWIVELCRRQGWTLVPNFADIREVATRGRIAVAPLAEAAGIQNKVLDAAALGLPQVVTSPALEGLAPGFPLEPVDDEDEFADAIVRLLRNPVIAQTVAKTTHAAVLRDYGVDAWTPWARELLAAR
jgi:hypothetical protein